MKGPITYNNVRKVNIGPVYLNYLFRGLFIVLFLSSCSSSRDIYNVGLSRSQQSVNSRELSTHDQNVNRPDWIYATSADFIVGQGEDTSISGAREKALDNLKLIIGKALPQAVTFSETSAKGNRVISRNKVNSESAFIFIQHISNVLDLELSLDFNNILDYYLEDRGNSYTYYVKYRINQSEIQKIKSQLKEQKRKRENLIDSLVFIDTINIVEDLVDRHHKINLLLQTTTNLSKRDSIRINNTMQRIETILNQLQIRDISETEDRILLEIHGFGRKFKTHIKPSIYHDDRVIIIDAYFDNGLWIINYTLNNHLNRKGFLDIEYNYPGFILDYHATVDNQTVEIVNRGIEIHNPRLEALSKNPWSGNITKMQFFMNIGSESLVTLDIEDMHLEIISILGPSMLLALKDYKLKLNFAGNYSFSALIDDCNVPMRFLRQVRHANIQLHFVADQQTQMKELIYQPITISL